MKRFLAILLAMLLLVSLAGCSDSKNEQEIHQIGVIVYDIGNEEVIGMREYLQGYIEKNYDMVRFVYSDSIRTAGEEQAFIQAACDAGVEGFLSFFSTDLEAEVKLCEQNGAYYMLASGTVSDEAFEAVADNPYFLGMFGPGQELEYQAGADMGRFFAGQPNGSSFLILSGGAAQGNDMHFQRTKGILDSLFDAFGTPAGETAEKLAATDKTTTVAGDRLTVTVIPGYYDFDKSVITQAEEAMRQIKYSAVLCVMPPMEIADYLNGPKLGTIDSYNARNLQLFTGSRLSFVEGKYSSVIGPAFALMLNAVTGYAEDFRIDGRAVTAEQGFWKSTSLDDYTEKYAFSNSEVMVAYSFDDLSHVIRIFNPKATVEDLVALAEACSYEDVQARRGG